MLKVCLIQSLRNFRKHKGYALLNLIGLSVGLALSILITLWIRHELSYDRFHPGVSQIYRVDQIFPDFKGSGSWPGSCSEFSGDRKTGPVNELWKQADSE